MGVLKKFEPKISYPWKRWTDGRPRFAQQGEHFHCTVPGFRTSLRNHAKRHGHKVQVVTRDGGRVEFQFTKRTK